MEPSGRISATAEGSPDEIALLDGRARYLAFAKHGRRLLGAGLIDAIGNEFAATWPEPVRAMVDRSVRQALEGRFSSFEAETQDPQGRSASWHVVLSPLEAAGPMDARLMVVAADVTSRKRAEMEQARRLERLQRQHSVTVRLVTDRTMAARGVEDASRTICELAAETLEVARCGVWLWNDDRSVLDCLTLFERKSRNHVPGPALRALEYQRYCEALETGREIAADVARDDPRTSEFSAGYFLPLGITSVLNTGIRASGETVGVLCCEHIGPCRTWQDDEITFAGVVADQIAQLIVKKQGGQVEQALRESEARLQTIVDSIQAGVLLIDAETHTIVEANPAALAMLGSAREAVLGRVCHRFVCPAGAGQCPVTDLGQTVNNAEHTLVKPTGEHVAILKTVIPIILHGRKHLLESFIDITHRKQAEVELAAHQERLEEMVRERTAQLVEAERQMLQTEKLASVGRLAAGVAHEINTPIQYVGDNLHALSESFNDLCRLLEEYRGLGEMIGSPQVAAEAVERLRVTEQEIDLPFILDDAPKAIVQGLEGVKRVANIVRAMKDFSHMKSGTAMSVDINNCLESTLTVARNEYKYVADVETHFDNTPAVECYPSEVNQVFLNLLVNAAHAIQDTGRRGKITITTRGMDDAVEIAIADTGTGIPEAIRGKIYDLFFTTKEVGRGTGQGLYLAYQTIVGKHGGTLHCESEVGEGTTFRITLPTRLPEQEAEGTAEPATLAQSGREGPVECGGGDMETGEGGSACRPEQV